MKENREHKRLWAFFYSPLVFIILLIVFMFLARSFWKIYGKERLSDADKIEAQIALVKESERLEDLKRKVSNLSTEQGIEDEIRSKFNVTKDGEGVALIVMATDSANISTTTKESENWWKKFVGYFKN